jgi:hypothetical protein
MKLPHDFLIRIAKKAHLSVEGAGIMTIVIMKPYAHLENELQSAFMEQEDVKVILDRRCRERRRRRQAVAIDRRKAGRRHPNKELVEVVIST